MKKTVWTFGLISGAILSAMMLVTLPLIDSIGSAGEIIGYTTMVLAGLLIFFGVRSYRDNVRGGTVGFGRALVVGLLITSVSTACYVATWELLYFKVKPSMQTAMSAAMVKQAKAKGGTPEQVAQRVAEVEKFTTMYQNPLYNMAMTFLEPLPVGVVLSLVSAGVLRRKRRRDDEALIVPAVVT